MNEPIPYGRGPTPPAAPGRPPRRHSPRRVMLTGAVLFGASAAVAALPLLWGRWGVNRYVVAFALVGACLGVSFALHGAWDWVRGKGRGPTA